MRCDGFHYMRTKTAYLMGKIKNEYDHDDDDDFDKDKDTFKC